MAIYFINLPAKIEQKVKQAISPPDQSDIKNCQNIESLPKEFSWSDRIVIYCQELAGVESIIKKMNKKDKVRNGYLLFIVRNLDFSPKEIFIPQGNLKITIVGEQEIK